MSGQIVGYDVRKTFVYLKIDLKEIKAMSHGLDARIDKEEFPVSDQIVVRSEGMNAMLIYNFKKEDDLIGIRFNKIIQYVNQI